MNTKNKEYSNRRKRHHPLLRSLRRKHKKQKRNLKTKRQIKVKMKFKYVTKLKRWNFSHDAKTNCRVALFTLTRDHGINICYMVIACTQLFEFVFRSSQYAHVVRSWATFHSWENSNRYLMCVNVCVCSLFSVTSTKKCICQKVGQNIGQKVFCFPDIEWIMPCCENSFLAFPFF